MSILLHQGHRDLEGFSSMERSERISSSSCSSVVICVDDELKKADGLNFKETELRLGLPGSEPSERKQGGRGGVSGVKRVFSDAIDGSEKWGSSGSSGSELLQGKMTHVPNVSDSRNGSSRSAKAQVVGWPPIRSFRRNSVAAAPLKHADDAEGKSGSGCLYVKVSMDGAPYLRKVDLKHYCSYGELSAALEKMFSCFTIGQCSSDGVSGRDELSESRLMDLLHGSEFVLTYEDKDGDWMLVGDVPWEMFTDFCKKLRIMKGSEAIGLAPRAVEKSKNRS